MLRKTSLSLTALLVAAGALAAADKDYGLKKGKPDLKSAGPLAFGPAGILLVGDTQGGAIFAFDVSEPAGGTETGPIKVSEVDGKIASVLGTTAKEIIVNDLAVSPASGAVYLSVSRGKGADAAAVIARVDRKGKVSLVPLDEIKFAKAILPNANDKRRQDAITHLAFVKDRIFVAGLSNEEFSSTLRAIPFPFTEVDKGTGVEIYHGAHGKFETQSPVRTFVPYDIAGQAYLLAAYQCTPLVKIPVADLKSGAQVKGTTIAELGNRNRPLDMIVYQKDGKDYILIANNSRGIMKVTTEGIDKIEAITKPVKGGGKAGLTYETVADRKDVEQLDRLDKDNAVILVRTPKGLDLDTIPLP